MDFRGPNKHKKQQIKRLDVGSDVVGADWDAGSEVVGADLVIYRRYQAPFGRFPSDNYTKIMKF